MIFRGKIMGIGRSPDIGSFVLIRPYSRHDGMTNIPVTAEGIVGKLPVGKKVIIEITEEG